MILLATEFLLWGIYFITREQSKRIYGLAKKVHLRRKIKIIEFANDLELFDEYDGPSSEFLNWVQRYYVKTVILLICVLICFMIVGYIDDPALY